MIFGELPRDTNGVVTGRYLLRHRSPDFTHGFGGVQFENGRTTTPIDGAEAERLLAALGDDVEAFPWDDADPAAGGREGARALSAPTSWQELEQLDEEQLRNVAAEFGANDRRWKAPRLRNFIAEQLGIDSAEAPRV